MFFIFSFSNLYSFYETIKYHTFHTKFIVQIKTESQFYTPFNVSHPPKPQNFILHITIFTIFIF